MNQKGISSIVIILIIVGVLVIGGVIWYYQNTLQIISQPAPQLTPPGETQNWKTYRNEKYGFEIKYPLDAYVKEITEGQFLIANGNGRLVNWFAHEGDFSEPLYARYTKNLTQEEINSERIVEQKINDYEALEVNSNVMACVSKTTYITNHKVLVSFQDECFNSLDDKWPTTQQQIINSFEFIR